MATRSGAGSASAKRWSDDVTRLVAEGLRRRAEQAGTDVDTLGKPAEIAERMLAVVPERSAWNALGPFYSTTGVSRILGGISRQAVEDRRRRHRLIALQTAEGTWVYPAFQFDASNRPIPALVDAHRRLNVGRIGGWTAASSLLGPMPELGGRSIVDHIKAGGSPDDYDDLIIETVEKNR